jgi:Protein of unknown function (DUF2795)
MDQDRESSKHGPRLDEEMAHETEDLVHSGHATHTEEWRQPEPVDEVRQPRPVAGGPVDGPVPGDVEARSELARALGRATFPADRDTLLRRAGQADLPAALTEAIAALPAGGSYQNVGALARALGLHTET